MARSSGNKDHSGASADPMDIDSDSGEEEEGAVDHERSDLQGEGDTSAKTNVAEDKEVIEEAIDIIIREDIVDYYYDVSIAQIVKK